MIALLSACGRLELDNPHGPPGVDPPQSAPVLPADHGSVGLVSAAGGAGRVRAHWTVPQDGIEDLEAALFAGPDPGTVLRGAAWPVDLDEGNALLEPVAPGVELFVALALRVRGAADWIQSGPMLRVHTGAVVYVNPALPPGSGDGSTPATAFDDVVLGALTALVNGGGSVWVARGDVANASIPLFTGVHVCGGFGENFILERRDPALTPTRFLGVAGQPIATIESGPGAASVLDGITLIGEASVPAGVDNGGRPAELRRLSITGCTRGVKLRSLATAQPVAVLLAGVSATGAVLEGCSVNGAFDVWLEGCAFDRNGNEGCDLNHLWAGTGLTSSITVRGSSFRSNGSEGLDVHLGAPAGAAAPGGRFEVRVQDCDFESNGLDGLRLDIDYETHPEWFARMIVRGSRARANRGAGFHLDLDAQSQTLLHGIVASANTLDGVLVTSESFAGMATIASSVLIGNLGAGAKASAGNVSLSLSHCVTAGNALGAVRSSPVASSAHSCAFFLEGQASSGLVAHACVSADDPDPAPFLNSPRGFATATGLSGGAIQLAAATPVAVGDLLELLDDGTARMVISTTGNAVILDPMPAAFAPPARGWWFASRGAADEDWRPDADSFVLDAGLVPPGALAVDAGVFGAPLELAPGRDSALPPELFAALETSPPWSRPMAANATLSILLHGGTLDPASIPTGVLAFRGGSIPLPIVPGLVAHHLEIPAPPGGWSSGDRIELHRSLAATDGRPLCAPLVVTLQVQ